MMNNHLLLNRLHLVDILQEKNKNYVRFAHVSYKRYTAIKLKCFTLFFSSECCCRPITKQAVKKTLKIVNQLEKIAESHKDPHTLPGTICTI